MFSLKQKRNKKNFLVKNKFFKIRKCTIKNIKENIINYIKTNYNNTIKNIKENIINNIKNN